MSQRFVRWLIPKNATWLRNGYARPFTTANSILRKNCVTDFLATSAEFRRQPCARAARLVRGNPRPGPARSRQAGGLCRIGRLVPIGQGSSSSPRRQTGGSTHREGPGSRCGAVPRLCRCDLGIRPSPQRRVVTHCFSCHPVVAAEQVYHHGNADQQNDNSVSDDRPDEPSHCCARSLTIPVNARGTT